MTRRRRIAYLVAGFLGMLAIAMIVGAVVYVLSENAGLALSGFGAALVVVYLIFREILSNLANFSQFTGITARDAIEEKPKPPPAAPPTTSIGQTGQAETLTQIIAETVHFHEAGSPQKPSGPPPAASGGISGDFQPSFLDIPLIGRQGKLDEVLNGLNTGRRVTAILGPGGIGKTRLAAEIVHRKLFPQGVIWHRIRQTSTVENELLPLVRTHLGLDPAATPWDALGKQAVLIVLDNAEDCEHVEDYIDFINRLNLDGGSRILLTSRAGWEGLRGVCEVDLTALSKEDATELVQTMARHETLQFPLDGHESAIAEAAKGYPGLIWLAVGWAKSSPVQEIIDELNTLEGYHGEEALDRFVRRTLERMVAEGPRGETAYTALKRLAACSGTFSRDAALALVGKDAPLALDVLGRWRLVRLDVNNQRYAIDPFVSRAIMDEVDETTREAHYAYYFMLAKDHEKRQDYVGLDPDSANLEAAFEWAIGTERYEVALRFQNVCGHFLVNRERFSQRMDWIERIAAAIRDTSYEYLRSVVQISLGEVYREHPFGNRQINLHHAVDVYTKALRFINPDTTPLVYAVTLNNLAIAYRQLSEVEDRTANLGQAITVYAEALRFCAPDTAPLDYAHIQNNLGNAYVDLTTVEDRAANLGRAIAAYTEALRFLTLEDAPLDYAQTQNNLGNAYWNLASAEDRAANLERAIAAYSEALHFRTPEAAPLDYAQTQNNLGNAYADLASVEDRAANLGRAIAAYSEALHFRTPEAAPLDYAQTQNNLGNAYADLASVEDRAANLGRAIAAYSEALRFRTPDAFPFGYVTTQNNLGSAYADLAIVEDRAANLGRVITAYTEALRFLVPGDAPLDYAKTQWNLGIAYKDCGDLPAAIAAWRESERYCRYMGHDERADTLRGWIADAEAQLGGESDGEAE